jgi:hypothetical protein
LRDVYNLRAHKIYANGEKVIGNIEWGIQFKNELFIDNEKHY